MTGASAAVFHGEPQQIELADFALPRPRGSEVLVRVAGCTLCGSDIHTYEGRRTVPVPTVLGHEIVGEIVEMGPSAPRVDLGGRPLAVGDRVTWAIVAHCGECPMCRAGLPQKCARGVKYGHESLRPGQELLGGLASHCLLVENTSIVRLPSDMPLAVACPANCATATVAAALEAAGDLTGARVCLFGAGMLGLTACAMARALGAAVIHCVDPLPERLALARQFGATHVSTPEEYAPAAEQSVGAAGFDCVVELSGSADAFHASWPLLRTGGTLVLVGSVFPGPPVPVALEQIVRRNLTIRGVHNYAPRHLQMAVDFLERHAREAPFEELVSTWYPLASIQEAFSASRQPGAIRVGITA